MSLDVLSIAQKTLNTVSADQNRDTFVKNLMETDFCKIGEWYNMMVCNLNNDYENRLNMFFKQ